MVSLGYRNGYDRVLVFGGHYKRKYKDYVCEYAPGESRHDWNLIGFLKEARAMHSAIRPELHDNEIYIIGGTDKDDFDHQLYTEVWNISTQKATSYYPRLAYYEFPVLMSVYPGYCSE